MDEYQWNISTDLRISNLYKNNKSVKATPNTRDIRLPL